MILRGLGLAVLGVMAACGGTTPKRNVETPVRDSSVLRPVVDAGDAGTGVTDAAGDARVLGRGAFEVPFTGLGTGCVDATSDWRACLTGAISACKDRGFLGGSAGVVDYTDTTAVIFCFDSSDVGQKLTNVPLTADPGSIKARSDAFQRCDYPPPPIDGPNAREPRIMGFGPVAETDGSFSTVCVSSDSVVKYRTWDNLTYPELHNDSQTPCRLDTESAPPVSLECTRQVTQLCRREGANYGYGPVNWGPSKNLGYADFGVVCLYATGATAVAY